MRRVVLLALALLMPVAGCANPSGRGTVARHRPGAPLEESKAADEATYGLYLRGQPRDATPLFQTAAADGTTVGFCRGAEGDLLAVAGHQAVPVPDGECEWRVVPGTARTRGEKLAAATDKVTDRVCGALLVTGLILGALGLMALYGIGKSNSNRGGLGAW